MSTAAFLGESGVVHDVPFSSLICVYARCLVVLTLAIMYTDLCIILYACCNSTR